MKIRETLIDAYKYLWFFDRDSEVLTDNNEQLENFDKVLSMEMKKEKHEFEF